MGYVLVFIILSVWKEDFGWIIARMIKIIILPYSLLWVPHLESNCEPTKVKPVDLEELLTAVTVLFQLVDNEDNMIKARTSSLKSISTELNWLMTTLNSLI